MSRDESGQVGMRRDAMGRDESRGVGTSRDESGRVGTTVFAVEQNKAWRGLKETIRFDNFR